MAETCGNCRFGIHFTDDRLTTGDCRRYPPKAGAMKDWPGVGRDDWCGEWQARGKRAAALEGPRPRPVLAQGRSSQVVVGRIQP